MRAEIATLKARLGTTMVYVTHDQIEAMTLADKIVVMNAGRIEQVGSPLDLYRSPANRFVAGFIGSPRMNMLPATLDEQGRPVLSGGATLPVAVAASAGAAVSVGIRAEHLALAEAGIEPALSGHALVVERLGSDMFVHAAIDGIDAPVILRRTGDGELAPGSPIRIGLDPARLHFFDETGLRLPLRQPLQSAA